MLYRGCVWAAATLRWTMLGFTMFDVLLFMSLHVDRLELSSVVCAGSVSLTWLNQMFYILLMRWQLARKTASTFRNFASIRQIKIKLKQRRRKNR